MTGPTGLKSSFRWNVTQPYGEAPMAGLLELSGPWPLGLKKSAGRGAHTRLPTSAQCPLSLPQGFNGFCAIRPDPEPEFRCVRRDL
jgi:hypothetical protein